MRLLLLAGTSEAVQVSHALSRDRRVQAVAALERASSAPAGLFLPSRIGGWQDGDELAEWITLHHISAVLDMSHPFADRITRLCHDVCAGLNIPFAQFLRPAWVPGDGDDWLFLNSEQDAARHVPNGGAVLLATGRYGLENFTDLGHRPIYVRVRERGSDPFPFPVGQFVHRPVPLPVPTEVASLRAFGVTWLVARNTGGGTTSPIIQAARELGLPVGMIRRPKQPEGTKITSIGEALSWVRRRL